MMRYLARPASSPALRSKSSGKRGFYCSTSEDALCKVLAQQAMILPSRQNEQTVFARQERHKRESILLQNIDKLNSALLADAHVKAHVRSDERVTAAHAEAVAEAAARKMG